MDEVQKMDHSGTSLCIAWSCRIRSFSPPTPPWIYLLANTTYGRGQDGCSGYGCEFYGNLIFPEIFRKYWDYRAICWICGCYFRTKKVKKISEERVRPPQTFSI